MNTFRGVGGRFLLGPLRRTATAQALMSWVKNNGHSRAVLRFATAYGAARLIQRAYPSLLPPTPLAGFSCERGAVKFKRNKSDGVFL
jgi:hypothetical protein